MNSELLPEYGRPVIPITQLCIFASGPAGPDDRAMFYRLTVLVDGTAYLGRKLQGGRGSNEDEEWQALEMGWWTGEMFANWRHICGREVTETCKGLMKLLHPHTPLGGWPPEHQTFKSGMTAA